jgi:phosphatidylserine/phosphatidylglycerophosphate/cardiolipin synthase-like enzyme
MTTLTATSQHIPFVHGSYPVRTGNAVYPLIDGEPAFRRICEAIEAAQHSVWVTVAFIEPNFAMPDGRGSLFDVLDRAVERGLDVRALFWRNNEGSGFPDDAMFSGSAQHRAMLRARGSLFHARWDRAQKAYCQHQKSWVIDAGQNGETTFIGGINLSVSSMTRPGHHGAPEKQTHDVYTELRGPSATDAHHNFVQRWNEASERLTDDGCWPPNTLNNDLPFPQATSPVRGDVTAQVQRTVRADYYTNGHPTPGGVAYPIRQGEHTLHEQYLSAIRAARRTIYIENQALGAPDIVEELHQVLERGVQVVSLVPAGADAFMRAARNNPGSQAFFRRFDELDRHPHFTLAGIAAAGSNGAMRDIYVHSKIMLIDDTWATIGSCNIGARSFFGDTELNVSFQGPDAVRRLRCDLFTEHLAADTAMMTDAEALSLFARIARRNAGLGKASGHDWQGTAFRLETNRYAR